jgi:hypothetical protein
MQDLFRASVIFVGEKDGNMVGFAGFKGDMAVR